MPIAHHTARAANLAAAMLADAFDSLPDGVVVVDESGAVVAQNPAAHELFAGLHDRTPRSCCDLLGCSGVGSPLAGRCVTAAALEHGRPLAALEVSVGTRRVEVVVAPLCAGSGALLHFRSPQGAVGTSTAPLLRVTTLGTLRLDYCGTDLAGEWLDQRPGRLLKYLICARGRRVPVDELVDALWPDSDSHGLTSLRQAVHGLRDRLEPGRRKQAPSRFILARPNAYELNMANIVVDADEFEREAESALRAATCSGANDAIAQLAHAAQLYRDGFLPDDPYADWAFGERDRLRELAARVLRLLAEAHLAAGELPSATSELRRLADLDPLDVDAQRDLIAVMIRRRCFGAAARRYEQMCRQLKRAFGHEPDFALSDLVEHPTRPA
jgi:DNA-binding SARP family transcriptional activator